jgi:hypothetical protein
LLPASALGAAPERKELELRFNKRRLVVAVTAITCVGLTVGISGSGASSTREKGTKVSAQTAIDWNKIAVSTVLSTSLSPATFQIEGLIYMSYVQAAEYNAVTAIDGRYVPYDSALTAARGASPRAAVAAAAYTTLAYYFPTLASSLVSTYTDYLNVTLAQLPEKAKVAGIGVGTAAAGQLIASRFGDGRNEPVATAFGVGPQAPGTWVFAPPPSAQSAQTPWVAAMKPFMLTSADQFRSPAPAAIGSPEYAAGVNEVEAMGGATNSARTPAQTATAQFWNANTINQYNQVFRDVAINHGLDLVDTVRLFAMGDMIGADAGIACMNSKYHYLLWRPVTAIRNADLDSNSATTPNATWSPLLTTPNHPEYPSAHGCVSSAVMSVLASVLKSQTINIDVPGATGGGTALTTTQHFNTVQDLLQNVADARVWAGLHFRFSTTAGVNLGAQVSQYDLQHNFLPARK